MGLMGCTDVLYLVPGMCYLFSSVNRACIVHACVIQPFFLNVRPPRLVHTTSMSVPTGSVHSRILAKTTRVVSLYVVETAGTGAAT